jgi:hypothetical protein
MTTGIDLEKQKDGTVVRTLCIGVKTMNGGVLILKTVTSVLPYWPTGLGAH